jgi:predicted molibdopterin-dependent oxidoreductase YjgC
VINRTDNEFAQACYHPQLVPIQTCDTCMVEINGQLIRACGTYVSDGTTVLIKLAKAIAGQRQGFDRISNLVLYYTVCDNNKWQLHDPQYREPSAIEQSPEACRPPHSARKECIVVGHSDKKGT